MNTLSEIKNKININQIIKILFIITSFLFVLPSIVYLIKNGTVYGFDKWFCFLLNDSDRNVQTIIYLGILTIMTVLYFFIVKKQKDIFKNIKNILIYTAVLSCIYLLSISFTCSDVFYYLGIGRIDSTYNQNPYYTTITQYVDEQNNSEILNNDTVLAQGYLNDWANTTVVYGPVWTIICRIVSMLSCGNIDIGILAFRIINIIIHILNCYLIYKISNKKVFSVLYGLNPFILFEGIMCVHNDIFVIFFILLALYFLLKKKNLKISLISLAMATAIKYFAILLLPLFVIYNFRKEKISRRVLKCAKYGILFSIILCIPYLFYVRDLNVLAGIFTQQTKFAKNFYIIIMEYFSPANLPELINIISLTIFIIIYFFSCLALLFKPKVIFYKETRKYENFLIAFLFLLITNFQPWYIMWLFPLIMWQKSDNIKVIVQISLISEFANGIFLAYSENWRNGTPYVFLMLLGFTIAIIYNSKIRKRKLLQ